VSGSHRPVVYLLLAYLIVGIPLEAKACAEDRGCAATPAAAISNPAAPDSQPDDSACCASCICCHGYAAHSSSSQTPIDSITALSVTAQINVLDGTRSTLEEPPRDKRG
jgi:hypothetical protein